MPNVIETTATEVISRPVEDDGGFDYLPATPDRDRAVAAAADAALMPGVAGRDEFLSLAMQARILHMSGAAPKAIRESVYVAFHVAMVGRDLGISPSASMQLIDVLETRNGYQLSLSPELMDGQVRRLGLGEIVPVERTTLRAVAMAVGPGGRDQRCRRQWPTHVEDCRCDVLGTSEFTWEDAQMAGLVGPQCQPGAHVKTETRRGRGGDTYKVCGCNQGYITYPKRMLWWRAGGFCQSDYFPEAGLGLYSPEELGAVVDEDGRPIDPATITLPEGYEPEALPPSPAEEPADPDDLWTLQAKLHALPAKQQTQWREQKAKNEKLRGRPTHSLTKAGYRVAAAMVSGLISAARRDGWDEAENVEGILRIVYTNLVATLVVPSPEGPEPGTPDPGPEVPDLPQPGDKVAGLVAELEQSVERAREAKEAVKAHQEAVAPDSGESAEAAPTGGDAAALTAHFAQVVEGMSVKDVRKDLRDYELPDAGPAATVRDRLIHKMVAEALKSEEPF